MVKVYKLNRFLSKNKKKVFVASALVVLAAASCVMLNNLVFGVIVPNLAETKKNTANYATATALYNTAAGYYKFVNFTEDNKKRYIDVQYNRALCNLEEFKFDEADSAIREGMYRMLDKYGLESPEYSDYVRNSVVEYYIKRRDFKSAAEYLMLAEYLYLKQKNTSFEIASIKRLYGDMNYEMVKIKQAENYYKDAYRMSSIFEDTDADEMITIVDRVANTYMRNDDNKSAITAYAKLIDTLNKKKYNDKAQYALVDWHTARALAKDGQNESALSYYTMAYEVVRNLPSYYAIKQDINVLRSEIAKVYTALGYHTASQRMTNEIQKSLKK